jgi:hypothetical protein
MKPQYPFFIILVLFVIVWLGVPYVHNKNKYDKEILKKVTYNPDSSMTFHGIGDDVTFTYEELPQLMEIFGKADQLDKELSKKIKIESKMVLGNIDNHEFQYSYSPNGYSVIFILTNKYEIVGVYQRGKYSEYFTKHKNKFDEQIIELNKIKNKYNIK